MSLNFRTRSISFKQDLDAMYGACCTNSGCEDDVTAALCNAMIRDSGADGRFYHNINCENIELSLIHI